MSTSEPQPGSPGNAQVEAQQRLTMLIFGFQPAQLVHVMTRLGLADLLAGGPMSIDALGLATQTRPDLLARVMRGLQGLGLVTVDPDARVAVTEMGALLSADAPGSMRHIALHGGTENYHAWGRLEHTLRTGQPAFEAAFGEPFFTYLRGHPEAGDTFNQMMTQFSRGVIAEVAASYDFATVSRVLDIGGGLGHLSAAVLTANPHLHGAVFDVPEVAAAAANQLAGTGLADRCVAIGGDFFEALPSNFDAHLVKWVLHDWNDDSCRQILHVCRTALPDHGRLLVVERLLSKTSKSGLADPAIAMDLSMLINFADARERSQDEYHALLTSCGFTIHQVVQLPSSGFSILDCRKAPA